MWRAGDVAIIDFIGRIEVKLLRVASRSHWSLVQIALFLALRMAAGEPGNADVSVPFPEDYQASHLAGRRLFSK